MKLNPYRDKDMMKKYRVRFIVEVEVGVERDLVEHHRLQKWGAVT
jgi:hypothetical protein